MLARMGDSIGMLLVAVLLLVGVVALVLDHV
jgi:hypothetical protein